MCLLRNKYFWISRHCHCCTRIVMCSTSTAMTTVAATAMATMTTTALMALVAYMTFMTRAVAAGAMRTMGTVRPMSCFCIQSEKNAHNNCQ